MKRYYEPLEMEITKFTAAPDCITTSIGEDNTPEEGGDINNPSNANYLAEF